MTELDTHLQTHRHPRGEQPAVAFFDLDRTLIAGYSILALAMETAAQGARRGKLAQSAQVIRDILKHKVYSSGSNYHRLVRRISKTLTGVSETTLSDTRRAGVSQAPGEGPVPRGDRTGGSASGCRPQTGHRQRGQSLPD